MENDTLQQSLQSIGFAQLLFAVLLLWVISIVLSHVKVICDIAVAIGIIGSLTTGSSTVVGLTVLLAVIVLGYDLKGWLAKRKVKAATQEEVAKQIANSRNVAGKMMDELRARNDRNRGQ